MTAVVPKNPSLHELIECDHSSVDVVVIPPEALLLPSTDDGVFIAVSPAIPDVPRTRTVLLEGTVRTTPLFSLHDERTAS